jgi:hypothetical protein
VNRTRTPDGLSKKERKKWSEINQLGLGPEEVTIARDILKDKGAKYLEEMKKLRSQFQQQLYVLRSKYIEETKQTYFRLN